MELEGMIVMELPMQEGVSKAGNPWKKKEWVLETPGMYPRKVKFHVFGDNRISMMPFEVGKSYAITIEIESREYQGRWYTDVAALGMRPLDGVQPGMAQQPMGGMQPQQPVNFSVQPAGGYAQPAAQQAPVADPFAGGDNNTDDLPF